MLPGPVEVALEEQVAVVELLALGGIDVGSSRTIVQRTKWMKSNCRMCFWASGTYLPSQKPGPQDRHPAPAHGREQRQAGHPADDVARRLLGVAPALRSMLSGPACSSMAPPDLPTLGRPPRRAPGCRTARSTRSPGARTAPRCPAGRTRRCAPGSARRSRRGSGRSPSCTRSPRAGGGRRCAGSPRRSPCPCRPARRPRRRRTRRRARTSPRDLVDGRVHVGDVRRAQALEHAVDADVVGLRGGHRRPALEARRRRLGAVLAEAEAEVALRRVAAHHVRDHRRAVDPAAEAQRLAQQHQVLHAGSTPRGRCAPCRGSRCGAGVSGVTRPPRTRLMPPIGWYGIGSTSADLGRGPRDPVQRALGPERAPVVDEQRRLALRLGEQDQQHVDVLARVVDDGQEARRARARWSAGRSSPGRTATRAGTRSAGRRPCA